jgi:hypothetical protein
MPVVFDATKASEDNRKRAEMLGWLNKHGDCAAISRKGEDGSVIEITEAMRREAVLASCERFVVEGATWEQRAARAPTQDKFILAMMAKFDITYEQAQAKIAEVFLGDV